VDISGLPADFKPIEPGSELSRLFYQAGRASVTGEHQRAVDLYTRALAIEPGPNMISRDLHALRGSEYNFLDLPDKALTDYEAAIGIRYYEMSDDAIRSYMGRGYAELNLKKYAMAKDDFDTVLKTVPGDGRRSSSVLAWRGAAWQGLGNRTQAVADYKLALLLDAENTRAREGLRVLGEPP